MNRNKDMFMAVFDNFLVHGACVKLLNCTIIELHIIELHNMEILNCIERYKYNYIYCLFQIYNHIKINENL